MPMYYDSFTWYSAQCQCTVIHSHGTQHNASVLWAIHLVLSTMPEYCDSFTWYSAQCWVYCDPFTWYSASYKCTVLLSLGIQHNASVLWLSLGTQHNASVLWFFHYVLSTMPVFCDPFTLYSAQCQSSVTCYSAQYQCAVTLWMKKCGSWIACFIRSQQMALNFEKVMNTIYFIECVYLCRCKWVCIYQWKSATWIIFPAGVWQKHISFELNHVMAHKQNFILKK